MLQDILLICTEYTNFVSIENIKLHNLCTNYMINSLYRYKPLKFIQKEHMSNMLYFYINKLECYRMVVKKIELYASKFCNFFYSDELECNIDSLVDFITFYKHKVKWKKICKNLTLNDKFIIEFEKYIKWDVISEWQILSNTIIEKYKDKLDWKLISMCQPLSSETIIKYFDKIDKRLLYNNPKITNFTKTNLYYKPF